jgi:hypothetical protein
MSNKNNNNKIKLNKCTQAEENNKVEKRLTKKKEKKSKRQGVDFRFDASFSFNSTFRA